MIASRTSHTTINAGTKKLTGRDSPRNRPWEACNPRSNPDSTVGCTGTRNCPNRTFRSCIPSWGDCIGTPGTYWRATIDSAPVVGTSARSRRRRWDDGAFFASYAGDAVVVDAARPVRWGGRRGRRRRPRRRGGLRAPGGAGGISSLSYRGMTFPVSTTSLPDLCLLPPTAERPGEMKAEF